MKMVSNESSDEELETEHEVDIMEAEQWPVDVVYFPKRCELCGEVLLWDASFYYCPILHSYEKI